MAGLEVLEVHSKSYLVRWINVKADHTISWSVQPHKKSLNFGIFKHPGHSAAVLNSSDSHSADSNENLPSTAVSSSRSNNSTSVIDKLTAIGLKSIQWIGKCEADKIAQGTYDVKQGEGGNYALVVDNTFSKQLSKTVTLVLFTYPTAVPPANNASSVSPQGTELTESSVRTRAISNAGKPAQPAGTDNPTVHTGILHKRRRKRHQGWARRYFTLDFTSSTLSYYHDRNTSTLRGSIPLSLAAVATNDKSREISVDSGAEIWHLRASGDQEFASWKRALEKASKASPEDNSHSDLGLHASSQGFAYPAENVQWDQVRSLVDQLSVSRDTVRQLAKDSDPKYLGPSERVGGRSSSPSPKSSPSATEMNSEDYVSSRKRSFWKRKASMGAQQGGKGGATEPSPQQLTVPGPTADTGSLSGDRSRGSVSSQADHADELHDRLMGVLRTMDYVVLEFSTLIAEHKRRLRSGPSQSRRSMESDISQEFFDANDGGLVSPLLTIQDSDDEAVDNADAAKQAEEAEVMDDAPSDSEEEMFETSTLNGYRRDHSPFFPTKPKTLTPLPLDRVKRRTNVPAPTVTPPSLIGFFRKNVGKDLSQISTPVSSNEPFSMLQRAAEVLEYSQLLDRASSTSDTQERLMYVTAFALSSLAHNRARERAARKPFNPMLGETFELIREDRGFRFISEKVCHRPVQLAYLAESRDWSLTQSPMPSQKFWGKSAEIVAEGKYRLTLHTTDEHFSWPSATSFLRNIIAGEKYVEPVGELPLVNETTGQKTISTFKSGGMFSGRSEEVITKTLDSRGSQLPLGLAGNWTSSLQLTRNGYATDSIWSAGPLVPNAAKHYGLTPFAASLNEITPIEQGKLPPTDSRLRPDQRALEDGDVDRAEKVKVELEEAQRARRREMEAKGESWTPRWFTRVDDGDEDGEVVWRLKSGKDGYWDERVRGSWGGVVPVFKA